MERDWQTAGFSHYHSARLQRQQDFHREPFRKGSTHVYPRSCLGLKATMKQSDTIEVDDTFAWGDAINSWRSVPRVQINCKSVRELNQGMLLTAHLHSVHSRQVLLAEVEKAFTDSQSWRERQPPWTTQIAGDLIMPNGHDHPTSLCLLCQLLLFPDWTLRIKQVAAYLVEKFTKANSGFGASADCGSPWKTEHHC